jgi:hypothetical protein
VTAPDPGQLDDAATAIDGLHDQALQWAADALADGLGDLAKNFDYLATQYKRLAEETRMVASLTLEGVIAHKKDNSP